MTSPATRSQREVFAGYTLVRRLGAGGMGEVFRAQKVGHGAELDVALKRILESAIESPEHLHYFLGEMRTATKLRHHNVVQVNDFGQDERSGRYFLVLELIEGLDVRTLTKRLAEAATKTGPRYPGQERRVLPIVVVAHIGIEVADGLHYIHEQKYAGGEGIIHRDISPDNIMLDIYGVAKVNDFGIARPIEGDGSDVQTRTEGMRGKASYASPEQCGGKKLDATTDVYALGVTLFQLATGRHPYSDPRYPNELPEGRVFRAMKKERAPIAELAPEMPPAMQELLESILQPDPRARPQAKDLVAPLKLAIRQALEADSSSGRTYDLRDIKTWAGRLVRGVYGPHTEVEMAGIRPEDLEESSAPKSHKRLIGHLATKPGRPGPSPDTESSGEPTASEHEPRVTPATAPMSFGTELLPPAEPTPEPAAATTTPPPRASRRVVVVALAICTLVLLALVAGIVGFAVGGSREEPTQTPVAAPEPPEPTTAPADPPELVADDTASQSSVAPSPPPPEQAPAPADEASVAATPEPSTAEETAPTPRTQQGRRRTRTTAVPASQGRTPRDRTSGSGRRQAGATDFGL